MTYYKNISIFFLIAYLFISGCSTKVIPTEHCKSSILVSEINTVQDFNYIDFFDLAVEVAKDNNFPPPMKYDKSEGLLVFGHKDIDTMPGHKMVIYLWVDNPSIGMTDHVCINYLLLDVRGSYLNEIQANQIIDDFKQQLVERYKQHIEDTKRIMEKYQVK